MERTAESKHARGEVWAQQDAARTVADATDGVPPMWMVGRGHEQPSSAEEAHWKENTGRAAARIMRLNADNKTFTRVPISMLTQEIERRGGFSDRTRAAFYTEVAASLVAKANERCHEHGLDV